MAATSSLILWTLACIIEARMDVWVERYKLDLIDRKGQDIDTGKWWAYNPVRPYRIGLLRDGWHFMKGVYILLIAFALAMPSGLPHWYCVVGSVVLIRAVVFPLALKMFRK